MTLVSATVGAWRASSACTRNEARVEMGITTRIDMLAAMARLFGSTPIKSVACYRIKGSS